MELPVLITSRLSALQTLCKLHKVTSLYLFGSVLTENFNSESDLDFVVSFGEVKPDDYADNFFDFRDALNHLFNRNIDLVEAQTLKNPYFKNIVDNTKYMVYADSLCRA